MADAGTGTATRLLEPATLVLLALAVTLGGGGVAAPVWPSTLIELAAVVVLACWAVAHRPGLVDPSFRLAAAFAMLLVATVAVQLVPLPPALWHALPGRASAFDVRELIGAGNDWFAFSLVPAGTWSSGLSLLPAIAAFFAVADFDGAQRRRLLLALLALIAADFLLGIVQISAADPGAWSVFPSVHAGRAVGVFVNRNHNAALLLLAPMIVAALLKERTATFRHDIHTVAIVAALAVFLVGVITTSSRNGFMLSAITIAVTAILIVAPRPLTVRFTGRGLAVVAGLAIAGGLLLAALWQSAVFARVVGRFSILLDDARFTIWRDSGFAARVYWPTGSGLGTFQEIFPPVERLETVTPANVNHAHNDYLELLVEMGLWGMVLVALFLLLYGIALWRILRQGLRAPEPISIAAAGSTGLLLIHSLTDYPLRTHALATIFGLLLALLLQPRAGIPRGGVHRPGRKARLGGPDDRGERALAR